MPLSCLHLASVSPISQMHKAKSNKELWAFLFNDFLLLTHTSKQFTSSGPDKLFSNKNNIQLKMYKPVSPSADTQPPRSTWWYDPIY